MSKYEKYLGSGTKIVIMGDELTILPIGIEFLPNIMNIVKASSGGDESNPLANFTKESSQDLKVVVDETLKASFPEMSDAERASFGMRYLMQLIEAIFNTNIVGEMDDTMKAKLDAFREARRKK